MRHEHITYKNLSILCFFLGLVFLGIGIFQGGASGGLFFIIPFVVISGPFAALGILLIFLGFVLLQFGFFDGVAVDLADSSDVLPGTGVERRVEAGVERAIEEGVTDGAAGSWISDHREVGIPRSNRQFIPKQTAPETSRKVKGGGIIFIGPIPIIFGDSVSMRYLIPAAIILFILILLAGYFL